MKRIKYKIACVGRIKEAHFTELIESCKREINRHGCLEIYEVDDERIPTKAGDKVNAMIVSAEGERLRSVIDSSDYIIALCIDGKKTTEDILRRQIDRAADRGCAAVTFVIGGSLGLSPDIVRLADYKMSVSDMTFPHQLMRVALVEQLAQLER